MAGELLKNGNVAVFIDESSEVMSESDFDRLSSLALKTKGRILWALTDKAPLNGKEDK